MAAIQRHDTIRKLPWAFVYTLIDRAALALLMVGLAPLIGVHQTGLVSLSMAIVFLALPVPQGIADAIVQLPRESERNFGYFAVASTGAALVLTLALWLLAPLVGVWLGDAEFASLLQLHALVILASGASAVPDGILARRLQFKLQAQRKAVGTFVGIGISIALAVTTRNALSLVAFHLISQGVSAVIGLATVRQSLGFRRFRKMRGEHRRIAGSIASQLLGQINLRSFDLIVGAVLTIAAVGLWRMGYNMMLLVTALTLAPAASLLLPLLSEDARSGTGMAARFVSFHKYGAAVAIPAFLGTCAGMPFLFGDLFPPEWAAATLAGQIVCLNGFANTISTLGLPALLASGNYRDLLTANLMSVATSLVLTVAFVPFGIDAVALCLVLKGTIVSAYVAYALWHRCRVPPAELLRNFAIPTISGGIAGVLGWLVASLVPIGEYLSLPVFAATFLAAWACVMLVGFRDTSRQVIGEIRAAIDAKS